MVSRGGLRQTQVVVHVVVEVELGGRHDGCGEFEWRAVTSLKGGDPRAIYKLVLRYRGERG